jgi:hypothetical protein
MAHFAKLDENNIVLEVNVVSNAALDPLNEEESGITFLTEWSGGYSNWKQTSYNGSFRKNYCGVGWEYDLTRNAFIPPKPYDSWLLNEETCRYEAPVIYPTDNKYYEWNEENLTWEEVIPPTE